MSNEVRLLYHGLDLVTIGLFIDSPESFRLMISEVGKSLFDLGFALEKDCHNDGCAHFKREYFYRYQNGSEMRVVLIGGLKGVPEVKIKFNARRCDFELVQNVISAFRQYQSRSIADGIYLWEVEYAADVMLNGKNLMVLSRALLATCKLEYGEKSFSFYCGGKQSKARLVMYSKAHAPNFHKDYEEVVLPSGLDVIRIEYKLRLHNDGQLSKLFDSDVLECLCPADRWDSIDVSNFEEIEQVMKDTGVEVSLCDRSEHMAQAGEGGPGDLYWGYLIYKAIKQSPGREDLRYRKLIKNTQWHQEIVPEIKANQTRKIHNFITRIRSSLEVNEWINC